MYIYKHIKMITHKLIQGDSSLVALVVQDAIGLFEGIDFLLASGGTFFEADVNLGEHNTTHKGPHTMRPIASL